MQTKTHSSKEHTHELTLTHTTHMDTHMKTHTQTHTHTHIPKHTHPGVWCVGVVACEGEPYAYSN